MTSLQRGDTYSEFATEVYYEGGSGAERLPSCRGFSPDADRRGLPAQNWRRLLCPYATVQFLAPDLESRGQGTLIEPGHGVPQALSSERMLVLTQFVPALYWPLLGSGARFHSH